MIYNKYNIDKDQREMRKSRKTPKELKMKLIIEKNKLFS